MPPETGEAAGTSAPGGQSAPTPKPPVTTPEMPAGEGTLLYEARPTEKTELYKGPVISVPAQSKTVPKRSTGKTMEPVPEQRSRSAAPGKKKQRSRGLGFALMFAVLLLLAAALAALLHWNSDRETVAPEPAALHLELGQCLESLLDEHAGTSR